MSLLPYIALLLAIMFMFNGHFYKDCLGLLGQLSLIEPPALIPLSWGIMTPNVRRFPPATVGSGLRMLSHVCFLSIQSPPPIWPVNTLHSVVRSFSWKAAPHHLAVNPSNSSTFPSIEFLWSTFTWMITSLEKWEASALFNGHFYKYFLGLLGQLSLIEPPALIPLSWGIMTPNVGRLPPATVGSGLRMLPHVCLLSTQSPPPIWPVNTLLTALLSCCLYLYLFIIKIFKITLNILDSAESSITT